MELQAEADWNPEEGIEPVAADVLERVSPSSRARSCGVPADVSVWTFSDVRAWFDRTRRLPEPSRRAAYHAAARLWFAAGDEQRTELAQDAGCEVGCGLRGLLQVGSCSPSGPEGVRRRLAEESAADEAARLIARLRASRAIPDFKSGVFASGGEFVPTRCQALLPFQAPGPERVAKGQGRGA